MVMVIAVPSGAASQGEAYRIGIAQFATHPALDAAVRGFKEGRAEGDIATAVSIAQPVRLAPKVMASGESCCVPRRLMKV